MNVKRSKKIGRQMNGKKDKLAKALVKMIT
jgi:hypothetical protein